MIQDLALLLRGKENGERTQIIERELGINLEQVASVTQDLRTKREKLIATAQLIYSHAEQRTPSPLVAAQAITQTVLNALLNPQMPTIDGYRSIRNDVDRFFTPDATHFSEKFDGDINPIIALREIAITQLGTPQRYLTRIFGARTALQSSVHYSEADTARAIRIPLIGKNEAFLFGAATVSMTLHYFKEQNSHKVVFNKHYGDHEEYFKDVIWPLARQSFNFPAKAPSNGTISTRAVYEFFADVLGYSEKIADRSLLSFELLPTSLNDSMDSLKESYFAGIISQNLKLEKRGGRWVGDLRVLRNHRLARQIGAFSERLGFTPSFDADDGVLYFSNNSIERLVTHGPTIEIARRPVEHLGFLYDKKKYAAFNAERKSNSQIE